MTQLQTNLSTMSLELAVTSAALTNLSLLMDSKLSDINSTSSAAIADLSSQVDSEINNIQVKLDATSIATANLSVQVDLVTENIASQLVTTSGVISNLSSQVEEMEKLHSLHLNGIIEQLNSTSIAITNLSLSVYSQVDLYQDCYRDTVNCTVAAHSGTEYWYLCHTPFITVNITVSATS